MHHKSDPFVLFLSLCQFTGSLSPIAVAWSMGNRFPPSWSVMFLTMGATGAISALTGLWVFWRRGDLLMVGIRGGMLLSAIAFLDFWHEGGAVHTRDIVLLVLSAVSTLPVVLSQIITRFKPSIRE